jgi:tetratricopeptide (TPR) repeat protein
MTAMNGLVRSLLVVALLTQSYFVVRDVRYDRAMRAGIDAYESARVDEVRERFHRARELDDDDPYLWAWCGDAAMYEYDYRTDGAVIDPAEGHALLDEAWRAYAGSVARAPVYSWSWMGLASVAERRARLEEQEHGADLGRIAKAEDGIWDPGRATALTAGHVALDLSPNGFMQLDVLAEVYASAGDTERAGELLVRSATVMPAPSYHSWGAGPRMDRQLYGKLVDALRRGVERAPPFEHSKLHAEIAQFARSQRDFDTALEEAQRAIDTSDGNEYRLYWALREKSQVLQEIGEYEGAIEALERLVETGQGVEAARRRLAHLFRLTGRYEEACAEYRRPGPGRADDAWLVAGALACDAAGEFEAAESLLRDDLYNPEAHPERARALLELYVEHGRLNTARTLLEGWIRTFDQLDDLERWAGELGLDK